MKKRQQGSGPCGKSTILDWIWQRMFFRCSLQLLAPLACAWNYMSSRESFYQDGSGDAALVMPRQRCQEVKKIVKRHKAEDGEAQLILVFRPWGSYERQSERQVWQKMAKSHIRLRNLRLKGKFARTPCFYMPGAKIWKKLQGDSG